ncbi:hypothetical protein V1517DRAFT_266574 [Lipomyces orientalis]|uniref:Uncharacterized protein n=1 Tax=Lipomyces orientalis TaxID=1233043 RepID=A0ACC3TDS9_9ASCO
MTNASTNANGLRAVHIDNGDDEFSVAASVASSTNTPFFSYADDRAFQELDAKYWAQQTSPSPPSSHLGRSFTHLPDSANSSANTTTAASATSPVSPFLIHSSDPLPGPTHSRSLSHSGPLSRLSESIRSLHLADLPELATVGNAGTADISTPLDAAKAPSSYGTHTDEIDLELEMICRNVQRCLDFREKYQARSLQRGDDNPRDSPAWKIYPAPPKASWTDSKEPIVSDAPTDGDMPTSIPKPDGVEGVGADFKIDDCDVPEIKDSIQFSLDGTGLFHVYEPLNGVLQPLVQVPTMREYYMDLEEISNISSDGPSKSFAFRRLQYLEGSWNLYVLTNEYQELADTKRNPHRDFYNVRKVDTHVHHSACMNQKHLLRFIKSKIKKCQDETVIFRDGKLLTLQQVFESLNLTAYDLSIDTLDMHAHRDTFHRFDKFNLKYNPIGESRLREIFLKTDNYIKGKYLAELTREVIYDLEQSKYQMAEYRISIYGKSRNEWDRLAEWVVDNKLFSPNVRWLIQVPRLYDVYKASGIVGDFEQIVTNLFEPLFEVSKDPSSHPKLHIFLQRVIGFDSVDDESKNERRLYRKYPFPREWCTAQNPPYSYYLYYLYANMTSLNALRKRRGFNTFVLRPHAGEAGDTDHLVSAFLVAHSISHGILLRKVPFLQYLYYLDQIGIAMSPLSNNALFLAYDKNPFFSYFKRGLNVSLSTDDPLQFAYTKEALIEEYSVAAQIYRLSAVDMCELAKNSVLQSGFEAAIKAHWLGKDFKFPGVSGNRVEKSNVPNVRVDYRFQTYQQEIAL